MTDTTQDTLPESFDEAATGVPVAGGTTIGPDATTKTLDKEAAQGNSADDAEVAKLNARIQADGQIKFSARTEQGRFRAPRSKGK